MKKTEFEKTNLTIKEIEKMIDELPDLLERKIFDAREDAWLSACEWIISLKDGEKADCKKAFEDYINSLT